MIVLVLCKVCKDNCDLDPEVGSPAITYVRLSEDVLQRCVIATS